MAKFKVGDRVIIRHDLSTDMGDDYFDVMDDMVELAGKEATITDVDDFIYDFPVYDLDIDEGVFGWTEDMFEEVAE